MAQAPNTSVTLLRHLASDTSDAHWTDFVARYDGLMRGFLRANYPTADEDDVLQETLLALTKALPNYRYTPDRNGYFHDYLIGIVKHKALDQLEKRARENEKRSRFVREPRPPARAPDDVWQRALLNAAVEQLLADETVSSRNREIFRHVALLHESPEAVAQAFGTTRGNVDVIKKRLVERLTKLVNAMSRTGNGL